MRQSFAWRRPGLADVRRRFFFRARLDDTGRFPFWALETDCFCQRGRSRRNVRLIHESTKPRVKAAVRQKFVVAAVLDNPPALEHEDLIGVTNG